MPARPREPVRQRRLQLADRQKQILLMTLLRTQAGFAQGKAALRPEHWFRQEDRLYQLVWAICLDFYERTGGHLPTQEAMMAELEQRLEHIPTSEEEHALLDEFLMVAYAIEPEELRPQLAGMYIKQLLEEHLAFDVQRIVAGDGDVLVDLPRILDEKVQLARSVTATTAGPLSLPFLDAGNVLTQLPKLEKTTTGMPFFDVILNGGHAPGEIYGFLAPWGGGKTLTGVHLACNAARHEQQVANARGLSPQSCDLPRVYMVFWEEPMISVRIRLLACMASVDKDTIEAGDPAALSTRSKPDSYKPYERRMYAKYLATGRLPPGEAERLRMAADTVNRTIRLIDFTGADRQLAAMAWQGAEGVAATIEADQQSSGTPGVAMVLADHANAAAAVACQGLKLDPVSATRHLVQKLPINLKSLVANRYSCPVWLFHQLDSKTNSRPPGAEPDASAAAEAKDFFQYCDYGIILGNQTNDGLAAMWSKKHRRSAGVAPIIVRVNGAMARLEATGNTYRIDRARIVSADHYRQIADVPEESATSSADMDRLMERRRRSLL